MARVAQDELRTDLNELFRGAVRLTLELVLEEEVRAMVGARRFERSGWTCVWLAAWAGAKERSPEEVSSNGV